MGLLKQILFDFRQGILARWKSYLLVMVIAILLSMSFYDFIKNLIMLGQIEDNANFADAIIYLFRGMEEYRPELKKAFDLTDSFLIWNLFLAYIVGSYPLRELRTTGKNFLIRTHSRGMWWFGKCIWNLNAVVVFYVCIFLGILIVSVINNGMELNINEAIFLRIFHVNLDASLKGYLMLQVMLLPVFSSMAISMLQMMVSLFVNEIVGYICTVTICGLSAYYMRWFLPANGTMVYRFVTVNHNGIGIVLPIFGDILIIFISYVMGKKYFENSDII